MKKFGLELQNHEYQPTERIPERPTEAYQVLTWYILHWCQLVFLETSHSTFGRKGTMKEELADIRVLYLV